MNNYHGYCRRQSGSTTSDLIEVGAALAIALLLGWAILQVMA